MSIFLLFIYYKKHKYFWIIMLFPECTYIALKWVLEQNSYFHLFSIHISIWTVFFSLFPLLRHLMCTLTIHLMASFCSSLSLAPWSFHVRSSCLSSALHKHHSCPVTPAVSRSLVLSADFGWPGGACEGGRHRDKR